MVQLVCVSATDYISTEPECTYIYFFLLCTSFKDKCVYNRKDMVQWRIQEFKNLGARCSIIF